MPALFDSRNTFYRTPFGAVPIHTEVYFRICLPRNWSCHAATLVVNRDARHPIYREMFWAGMAGDSREYWDVRFTPDEAGLYWYAFRLELEGNTAWLTRQPDGTATRSTTDGARWQLTGYETDFTTPDWLAGGIMYQIFPDRFAASGTPKVGVPADRLLHEHWEEELVWQPDSLGRIRNNDFYGGDLRGIQEKLPYLASLGVTCLYLNPIFESHSNHRYDTADYTHIDPLLGNEADFRALCTAAADLGIRVLLDGVFSHTGADSVYFNRERRYPGEGAYNSLASPYSSWYHFRRWPQDYHGWWGFMTLPEVDELAPAFMDYVNGENGIVARWLEAGAAGWRLDVADELPDGFLEALRRRAKATKEDALVLGEVWEDASNKESYGHRRRYLLGQQLDSVMNYPFREAILVFLREGDGRRFGWRVLDIVENYPPQVLHSLMNHIGTHDTERVLTLLGGESLCGRGRSWQAVQQMTPEQRCRGLARLRLATLLQFALPGVPCIYYGDEAGMEGYKDPFNRRTFPWGREDAALTAWYRQLGAVRGGCPALKVGTFTLLAADRQGVCFIRREEACWLVCGVNRGDTTWQFTLPPDLPDGRVVLATGWPDDTLPEIRNNTLELPALSGVWILRKNNAE